MFQYAFGRTLAHKHNAVLKLDISWYNQQTKRTYELSHFNIQENIATKQQIENFRKVNQTPFGRWLHSLCHNHPKKAKSDIRIKLPHFEKKYLNLPDNIYLFGYFQSAKYFQSIDALIRKEFTLKNPISDINQTIADEMTNCCSVNLCVRRGDYITEAKTAAKHGFCDIDYYRRAIEKICSLVKKPHFFVFSNDIDWCRDKFKLNYPITYMAHQQNKPCEDLRLMTFAKHHIIPNSSFHWWGAYLAGYENKIVIAPVKWFARKDVKTDGMLPEEWIKI